MDTISAYAVLVSIVFAIDILALSIHDHFKKDKKEIKEKKQ